MASWKAVALAQPDDDEICLAENGAVDWVLMPQPTGDPRYAAYTYKQR